MSEQKLEELLKVIETHCSWILTLGTLDLKTWEKIGTELRELYQKGVPLPVTMWNTWQLVRPVLEPLQSDTEYEGEEDDPKSDDDEEKLEGMEEESLEAPRAILKSLDPSLRNWRTVIHLDLVCLICRLHRLLLQRKNRGLPGCRQRAPPLVRLPLLRQTGRYLFRQ